MTVGIGFLDRKILIALTSTKLSKLGKSTRPYMSRARIDSKAPWKPPLIMKLGGAMSEGLRWRATAIVEALGVSSRSLKGSLSGTSKPTK